MKSRLADNLVSAITIAILMIALAEGVGERNGWLTVVAALAIAVNLFTALQFHRHQ